MQGFELPATHFVAFSWCCYAQHGALEALERDFLRFFLLAPAAANREPTPGQPAEVLRSRERRHVAALAEPLGSDLVSFFLGCVDKIQILRLLFFEKEESKFDLAEPTRKT
jgi:hypothetical protein